MSFLTTISTPEEVRTAQQQKTEQQKIEEEAKKQIFVKDYGFTIDQAKALNDALASVGLGKINAATKKVRTITCLILMQLTQLTIQQKYCSCVF